MALRTKIDKLFQQEDLNFVLTNHIPRQLLTRLMGWFSQIENPWLCKISIAIWSLFADLDLREAKKSEFRSLHECFTRELKEDARTIDSTPTVAVSPCDGIVGAHGAILDGLLFQAKGSTYTLSDLILDPTMEPVFRNGYFVTLRLTSSMYHRFHAPHDCQVDHVTYIAGDAWNVNPAALKRVPRLFCQNERAVLRAQLLGSQQILAMVPVAAILVASIRLHFLDVLLHMKYRGPNRIPCKANFRKGEEMGWFEHGSTIILLAPQGFTLCDGIRSDTKIRMGQALLRLP